MIITKLKPTPEPKPSPRPRDVRVRQRFSWWPTVVVHDTGYMTQPERYLIWLEHYWEKQQFLDVSDNMWLEEYDWVTIARTF